MPNDTRPQTMQFELFFPGTTLAALTREDANGVVRHYIGGTASSTAKDLQGSIIKPEAQVMMLEKLTAIAHKMADANSGMTAWVNHSYKIPEDCLGAFTAASLTTREEKGEQFIDLDIECRLVDFSTNPRAEAAYKQVLDGIRHGWSIGAYFTDIEYISDDPKSDDYWSYAVTGIELLEISLVGIPANQRAWVRDADSAKAYAVSLAERIASESHSVAHRRDLVRRSIVEHRTPAGAERLAMADDFRQRAQQPFLDAENVKAFNRAAEALEKRDDGAELSPDDMRDRIGLSIAHLAKSVGHGLCIKSATHVARAIDCLSGVIGSNGGVAEPAGDEDPSGEQMSAELEAAITAKREALALLETEMATATELTAEAAAELTQRTADSEARLAALTESEANRTAEALARSAESAEALAAAQAELSALQASVAASTATLAELQAKIDEAASTRLGRKSHTASQSITEAGQSLVKAEHYHLTPGEQDAAIARMATGDSVRSGRDMAR